MVEVEFDFVGRRTNGLITSELELLNEILMGILSHLSALISVKEDEIDIERSSNKRSLVSAGNANSSAGSTHAVNSPEALTNGTEINVDFNFVILYFTIPHLSVYLSAFKNQSTRLFELSRGIDYILSHH